MSRIIITGEQDFVTLRQENFFYIDKTKFIIDWWNHRNRVTLITRPRRFGKTLMLDTVKTFFSQEFADRADLFEGLEIWQYEKFRNLQGTIPVISLSFSGFDNNDNYESMISRIKASIASIYGSFTSYININAIPDAEKEIFTSVCKSMSDATAQDSLHYLCKFIKMQHNIKPIILLDAYDTPVLGASLNDFWDKLSIFMGGFFNATFKNNPWLERGLITGITRVAKESMFLGLNNLKVVSCTSGVYADCFGFTEQEVFAAMDEYALPNKKEVKKWYDGFIFGNQSEIYNPWSIIEYLSEQRFDNYWANTSDNSLVGTLLAKGGKTIKEKTERLLNDESIITEIDEHIDFRELYTSDTAIWSLLLAAGYIKALSFNFETGVYELILTNREAKIVFMKQISRWFNNVSKTKNQFIDALLHDNLESMNLYMTMISKNIFNFFDIANSSKQQEDYENKAENFYHAFVLGLIVDLKQYDIRSNSDSGYGRCDVMLIPKNKLDHGIVIEFKTTQKKEGLHKTCDRALKQIYEKEYIALLQTSNVLLDNIYVYGFAFKGQRVQIMGGAYNKIDWTKVAQKK